MAQDTAKRKQQQRRNGSTYKLVHSTQVYKDIFWGVPPITPYAYRGRAIRSYAIVAHWG
jgi:hypothetical protein